MDEPLAFVVLIAALVLAIFGVHWVGTRAAADTELTIVMNHAAEQAFQQVSVATDESFFADGNLFEDDDERAELVLTIENDVESRLQEACESVNAKVSISSATDRVLLETKCVLTPEGSAAQFGTETISDTRCWWRADAFALRWARGDLTGTVKGCANLIGQSG